MTVLIEFWWLLLTGCKNISSDWLNSLRTLYIDHSFLFTIRHSLERALSPYYDISGDDSIDAIFPREGTIYTLWQSHKEQCCILRQDPVRTLLPYYNRPCRGQYHHTVRGHREVSLHYDRPYRGLHLFTVTYAKEVSIAILWPTKRGIYIRLSPSLLIRCIPHLCPKYRTLYFRIPALLECWETPQNSQDMIECKD